MRKENFLSVDKNFGKKREKKSASLEGKRWGCLGDFRFGGFFAHGAQGGSGDFDLLAGAVFEGDADGAQVGKLALLGFVVGVGNVVSYQGAFAGDLTSSCHDRAFRKIGLFSRDRMGALPEGRSPP